MKTFLGEALGTFILVFLGISSVAFSVLNGISLFQVASVWCIAVILGIYLSRKWSNAHLNPAVSVAFLIQSPKTEWPSFFSNILGQLIGGVCAAFATYLVFDSDLAKYEQQTEILRNTSEGILTSCVFTEYFPNPGLSHIVGEVSVLKAFCVEGGGTSLLVLFILYVSESKRIHRIAPVLIGIFLGLLIYFLAPYTQGGFNPTRDYIPRIFVYFAGWQGSAFQNGIINSLLVYVIGPFIGAILAAFVKHLLNQLFLTKK